MRCLSLVSLLPAVYDGQLSHCVEKQHLAPAGKQSPIPLYTETDAFFFGCPILLAVGNIKQYNNQLPCRCNALLLHIGGELMVIYCKLYTDLLQVPSNNPTSEDPDYHLFSW